ncbi:MAG TPA: hypothetical protein VFG83_15805, partial [Kofleriaceae bacterium]|nr:hypothetical protein [Kofleriaceae bacterium]
MAPTLFFAAAMVGVAACARVAAKAPEHGGHSAATPPAATARAPEAKSEPPSAPAPAPRDDRADDPARIALTERYRAVLSGAKTPAGAIDRLGERARQSGAVVLPAEKLAPGARYLMADGTDLALIATGTEPLSAGVRIIVTFVDPPAVRLASSPPENRSGVITGDLVVDEGIDLGAWLSRPLAFYVSWARRGQTVIAVIGDSPGEPAFVFPDLLPHLSRKVQRRGPVDRTQRVDVLLAPSLKFLRRGLSAHKIPAAALAQGEVILAPAAPPVRVGATGDLLAAYGQAPLAVTFVAADALLSATTPP